MLPLCGHNVALLGLLRIPIISASDWNDTVGFDAKSIIELLEFINTG